MSDLMPEMQVLVTLPWPPSANHYLGSNGKSRYLTPKAREYRSLVANQVDFTFEDTLLAMRLHLYPPDARRRDIDNPIKNVMDSLQQAGAFIDDSQIKDLHVIMCEKVKPGRVVVGIRCL